jgi:hypothetical protein
MKTLQQMEEKIWNEWYDAHERGETVLPYDRYFDAAMGSHNDLQEDSWQTS